MTNLCVLLLSTLVTTNYYDPSSLRPSTTNGVMETNKVCCVSTVRDYGLADGTYLFSTWVSDKDCEGIPIVHWSNTVFINKKKARK